MIYDDIPNGDTRKLKIKNAFENFVEQKICYFASSRFLFFSEVIFSKCLKLA